MTNVWYICVTTGGSDGTIVETTTGSAEQQAFASGKEYGQYIPVGGPYTSLATAQKDLPAVVAFEKSAPGGVLTSLENAGKAIVDGFQGATSLGVSGGDENPSGTNVNDQPASWETAIEDVADAVTSLNTYIRFAKVIVGISLIIIGVNHLVHFSDTVTKVASKVPVV